MRHLYTTIALIFLCANLTAQVNVIRNANPQIKTTGLFSNQPLNKLRQIPDIDFETVYDKLKREKYYNKFAEPVQINLDPLKSGQTEIINNHQIIRLKISTNHASSLTLFFDKLKLSANAEMYIYDEGFTTIMGPVTSSENISHNATWGTTVFKSNAVIIEFKSPVDEINQNTLNIDRILYGLDFEKTRQKNTGSDSTNGPGYGNSLSCNENVICHNWALESNGVAVVVENGGGHYTGSLVMNTCSVNKPYFLTAWHCIVRNGQQANPANLTFEFLWISPTCSPTTNTSNTLLFNGATIKALWEQTDFALLELSQSIPSNSNLTFLGWSRSSTTPNGAVLISHPRGDIMKIAIEYDLATIGNVKTFQNTAWRVQYDVGASEDGSSGGPLFDVNHRVIGQAFSNTQICNSPSGGANFGRFDISWDGGGTSGTRLKDWLDPNNSGATTTNSSNVFNLNQLTSIAYSISGPSQFCTSGLYSIQNLPSGASVQWNITTHSGQFSQSTNNNQLTITRIADGNITINATINICGFNVTIPSKTVQIGAYPVSLTAYQIDCDEVEFEVIGTTATSFNWSRNYGDLLFGGTMTSLTTSIPEVAATGLDGSISVSTTNVCGGAINLTKIYQPFYQRNLLIGGVTPPLMPWDQLSVTIDPYEAVPFVNNYKWYVNGILVKEGEGVIDYCTCDNEGPDQRICDMNVVTLEGVTDCGTFQLGYLEFEQVCYGARANLEAYPNPIKDLVTIKLRDIKGNGKTVVNEIKELKVLDKLGQIKKTYKFGKGQKEVQINISDLPSDIYIIEVNDGTNRATIQVIKVK